MAEEAPEPVRPVVVGASTASHRSGIRRVTAPVDGHEVWFESADTELVESPEAFASGFLLPAMLADRPLVSEASLDSRWLDGAAFIGDQATRWWGIRSRPVEARPTRRSWRRRRPTGSDPTAAICFTGGVDSFHTLLTSAPPPDLLVMAIGYDIGLDDTARADDAVRRLRAIAGATGTRAVVITTNLLEHPLHQSTNWELVHGGPLAALGLVTGVVGTLSISSSFTRDHDRPWGTHWTLDRHWSTRDLEVVHVGDEVTREQKVAAIAPHPLALDNLQVCWEHLGPIPNCGRCDKCLETMVMLHHAGALDRSSTLPKLTADDLAHRLGSLPTTAYRNAYRRLLDDGLAEPIASAVGSLLMRAGSAGS